MDKLVAAKRENCREWDTLKFIAVSLLAYIQVSVIHSYFFSSKTINFQLETLESRLAETHQQWKTAENSLTESKASWEEHKRLHAEELKKLTARCEELTSQNTLLHQQGEKVVLFDQSF